MIRRISKRLPAWDVEFADDSRDRTVDAKAGELLQESYASCLALLRDRLGMAGAAFNIIADWRDTESDEEGDVYLSIAELSLQPN